MKKLFLCVLIIALMSGSTACAQPVASEVPQSEKQRVTFPNVSETDEIAVVNGNSAFAFDLYQVLRIGHDNYFYSPHSISLALAMTYAGARGMTEEQMANVLHFTLPQDSLHPAFNWLDSELGQRCQGAQGKDDEGFRLNIVNAVWGQKGYPFLVSFLDLLAENYGAGLKVLDFIKMPEDSRITINNWVSDQTEGRIEDLIPPGAIDELTVLILTNAIYFNAAWQHPFSEEMTKDDTFHLHNGGEVTVPMMWQTESFGYAEGKGYQAVELPYDGCEFSMLLLLPEPGQFETFQDSLNAGQVDDIVSDLEQRQVALTMPKFEFESDFSLKEALAGMGMPVAFSGGADFSGMARKGAALFIGDVLHKTFVAVDEAGTEAAAATAVIISQGGLPGHVEVTIDRPFVFLIRDNKTGAILFVGRVVNPKP